VQLTAIASHVVWSLAAYLRVRCPWCLAAASFEQGITDFDFKLVDAIDACKVQYSPKFLKEQDARLAALK